MLPRFFYSIRQSGFALSALIPLVLFLLVVVIRMLAPSLEEIENIINRSPSVSPTTFADTTPLHTPLITPVTTIINPSVTSTPFPTALPSAPSDISHPISPTVPTVSAAPTPTPPSSGEKPPFIQVDPTSGTDNEVNAFIKSIVQSGNRNVAAVGAWWGPTDRFFENQIWTVNRTLNLGKIYQQGNTISAALSCLLPGKTNPTGQSRNFLAGVDGNLQTPPRIRMQQTADNPSVTVHNNPLGQFTTLSQAAHKNSGTLELRTNCTAREGNTNQFGDGAPTFNDEIRAVMGQAMWYGNRANTFTQPANHDGLPFRSEWIDVHAWYQHEGYVYGSIDGATMISGNQTTQISTTNLIGGTVSGKLTVSGFAKKGAGEVSKTGHPVNTTNMPIHHIELRIEQDNEDYAADYHIAPTGDHNGLETMQGRRVDLTLDTTKVTDGWHILSWHVHALDKANPTPYRNKQLAGEVKIPICVENNPSPKDCP